MKVSDRSRKEVSAEEGGNYALWSGLFISFSLLTFELECPPSLLAFLQAMAPRAQTAITYELDLKKILLSLIPKPKESGNHRYRHAHGFNVSLRKMSPCLCYSNEHCGGQKLREEKFIWFTGCCKSIMGRGETNSRQEPGVRNRSRDYGEHCLLACSL